MDYPIDSYYSNKRIYVESVNKYPSKTIQTNITPLKI